MKSLALRFKIEITLWVISQIKHNFAFQISSLVFAPNYKELVSAHGYAHNNVVIWKYPSLSKVAELNGKQCDQIHSLLFDFIIIHF